MNLTFEKQGDKYVATFEATSDFNLHIEKRGGRLSVMQSSVSGSRYDHIKGAAYGDIDGVIDSDFVGSVYPKYIKVECDTEPTLAVVTFNA